MPQALSCAKSRFRKRCSMRLPSESRFLLSLSGLALASLGDASLALGSPSLPKVTVESGELEGTHFGYENDVAVLGVRYAAPPVGELRWKPPQPVSRWNGTRQPNQVGPAGQ